jgi:hypothetical protein
VVVGDEHLHAERRRRLDAGMCRDAIVHREQQVGALVREVRNQPGRQAVAVPHAVGHAKPHVLVAKPAQLPHHDRRAGRAIGVEISDHEDA